MKTFFVVDTPGIERINKKIPTEMWPWGHFPQKDFFSFPHTLEFAGASFLWCITCLASDVSRRKWKGADSITSWGQLVWINPQIKNRSHPKDSYTRRTMAHVAFSNVWTTIRYSYTIGYTEVCENRCHENMEWIRNESILYNSSPEIKDISSPLTIISDISYYTPEQ